MECKHCGRETAPWTPGEPLVESDAMFVRIENGIGETEFRAKVCRSCADAIREALTRSEGGR